MWERGKITLRLKSILINPWVYDFALMNLWSRPLGLLRVAEYMSRFDLEMGFIDCMDVIAPGGLKRYGTGNYPRTIVKKPRVLEQVPRYFARYGMSIDTFREKLKKSLPCDFVFVTSVMAYWYPGVQKVIEIVKELSPQTPVILGGIYATLYHEHALKKSGADIVYRGHIGSDIETVLRRFGFSMKKQDQPRPYYRLGLYQNPSFAPLLTSYGCPFRCAYCASFRLFQGFTQRNPFSVLEEIESLYKAGVRDFAFYDDALLVNADSHINVILREIIKKRITVRFHCPNGLHARLIDDEQAYLMKESGFTTLRLGFETINDTRQQTTGGKVTGGILRLAIKNLKRYGFRKEYIGVYLMYGLPGQEFEEVKEGIEFLKGLDIRIHLTEFSPIPNTPCWEELLDKGVIESSIDPIVTNNTVFSYLYSNYDRQDLKSTKLAVKEYNKEYSSERVIKMGL
ncbi:MAG: radical SAM protein [Nitrospiraceae bacterium]|nr:MAG: radical SAM protein [Nitrospiraceae bacterium]